MDDLEHTPTVDAIANVAVEPGGAGPSNAHGRGLWRGLLVVGCVLLALLFLVAAPLVFLAGAGTVADSGNYRFGLSYSPPFFGDVPDAHYSVQYLRPDGQFLTIEGTRSQIDKQVWALDQEYRATYGPIGSKARGAVYLLLAPLLLVGGVNILIWSVSQRNRQAGWVVLGVFLVAMAPGLAFYGGNEVQTSPVFPALIPIERGADGVFLALYRSPDPSSPRYGPSASFSGTKAQVEQKALRIGIPIESGTDGLVHAVYPLQDGTSVTFAGTRAQVEQRVREIFDDQLQKSYSLVGNRVVGLALEWSSLMVFLGGLGILVWRFGRRSLWGGLAAILIFFFSPVLLLTGAAALASDSYSNAILRSLRPGGTALEWSALFVLLSGLGILVWREARKLLLRRAHPIS